MIGRGLMEKVITGNRNERVYLCEQEFAAFAMYYFSEFFTYRVPAFQWVMYKLLNEFVRGRFTFLLWIMFRESAKTTIAKIYVVYCIVYRKKRFINWDSYDKGNAESALFDIATFLQTNRRIIADFGQLFFEDPKTAGQYAKMKRIHEFITANRVKVKAYSTQESTRGRIYLQFRPDLYVLDDFETMKTVDSIAVTAKIIKHIDELKSGLSVDGQVIFLCNLISETGSVAGLLQEAKENPDSWRHQVVNVEDEEGNIAWPDKFVHTREEAHKANLNIKDPKEKKISLEQKKKDLNAGGRKVYEAEMMNSPESSEELFFDRERVERDIAAAKKRQPIKVVGGFSMWEEYKAKFRYAIGGDTSKGVGRDACATAAFRFAFTDKDKSLVVGTYHSNTTAPDDFGDEMAAQGNLLGQCLLAPELNNTGFATVTRLKGNDAKGRKIYPVHKIYRRRETDQVGGEAPKRDLGWEATAQNVAAIYYNFRTAYNDGLIEIFCPILLNEMRVFTKRHLEHASKRLELPDGAGVITKHFDLLRAACIGWEMRHYALAAKKEGVVYKQEAIPEDYYDRS